MPLYHICKTLIASLLYFQFVELHIWVVWIFQNLGSSVEITLWERRGNSRLLCAAKVFSLCEYACIECISIIYVCILDNGDTWQDLIPKV